MNGSHLGMPNCKKPKWLHTRNILARSWINFNQHFLRYRHFCVYAIFSNGSVLFLLKFWNQSMQKSFWHKSGQNPLSGHWDIVIFMFCAIFSNGGHLGYSTWPNFTILKPWSQAMLHVKFENCRCSSFREKVVWSCINVLFLDMEIEAK